MLREVSIEILRKCPSACIHCSSLSDTTCSEEIEYDKFVSIVSDAKALGAKTICLSGGEPFLHPQIVDMIVYSSSLGLNTYVYTSGIVLDYENNDCALDKNVLKAIAGRVTKLIFNIEASKADTYNAIMKTTGCFEIMKKSVALASKSSIITEAHFVPMKLNIGEIEDTIEMCKDLGISKVSFLRLVLHGRALNNEREIALSDAELVFVKALLERLKKENGMDIRIGVPLSSDNSCHKCEAANGKLNIRYDGKVFPCEVFKNDRLASCFQGLESESINSCSLKDIYKNSQYLQTVRRLSQEFNSGAHYETCVGQYLMHEQGGR